MEPLQGYGGIFPLKDGYLRDAFNMVRERGGVAIADEVQTGFNRCGETFWGFAMKHNDAMPDMITIAKGMGNGVGIIGAVICRRSIAEAFTSKMVRVGGGVAVWLCGCVSLNAPSPKFFNTYGSNPVACAASRAVLRVMDDEKILENCSKMGKIFRERLGELCKQMPQALKEVRGSGLFQGLEISGKTIEQVWKGARPVVIAHTLLTSRFPLCRAGRTPLRCTATCWSTA